MKHLFLALIFIIFTTACFGQKNLVSYDDIKYLLHINLTKADTFLMAKGYYVVKKDNNNRNRKYTLPMQGGKYNNINLRLDGKKIFIEIETNEINQYNIIRESVSQYLVKDGVVADIQTYAVKDLGNIYIEINDTVPYNPLTKDYNIHVVPDKGITADY